MENELVRYSRAGDAFHYRWAARRCLRLLDPHSSLKCITIEASRESNAPGEYVIDLAEYSDLDDGRKSIGYFQLKHTTARTQKSFAPSELADTLKAFGKRYSALFPSAKRSSHDGPVAFSFVTNRPVSKRLKQAVIANARGGKTDQKSQKYLELTTGLRTHHLQAFCASFSLVDGEGDYIVQKEQLTQQMSEYIAGFVDSQEVDAIIAMVADRALPKSEDGRIGGEIHREDILQRFGVTSERDLFPAPPELEHLPSLIKREQHDTLLGHIMGKTGPIVVHAAGGVGKSVVARQLAQSLPTRSQGFVYDCFGGGKYRNPSEPRHRACDALVQLANEMAARGLCRPLITHGAVPADSIFRAFLARLQQASDCLREVDPQALLVLFIDAADNAELVAKEYGDRCFAHELLRETLPPACRLVMFCRTERIGLLMTTSEKGRFELRPFSKKETAAHLRQIEAAASDRDCLEFHRLTGGNPRVQANALGDGNNVAEVLLRLGPRQATVSAQIASQLDAAISSVKDRHVDQSQIDAICYGLANLPPFVPLDVLAKAAGVDVSTVHSFISDLGRPLWHTDNAVQFRDEPTETWFRERFGATKVQIVAYLAALEPLAKEYTYVAKVLPQLLLRSENYDRLIRLALSDDLLPEGNAIDERDIRLYRLQFAFKAALRLGRYADATRLALRAGEEAAGNERQLSLLQSNLHLIAPLQGAHRIQELAYRQVFRSAWEGSQNLFSASLLSSTKEFHGEARAYLRASQKWLEIYFAARDKRARVEKEHPSLSQDELREADIAELSWAHLNLYGPSEVVKFITGWRPPQVTFQVTRLLIGRLVDAARFEEIDQIAILGDRNVYLMLAVADELMAVAHFAPKQALSRSLNLLATKATRIPKPQPFTFEDQITPSVLSLMEACVARQLSRKKIRAVVQYYAPAVADWSVGSNGREESRRTYIRGAALVSVLSGDNKVATSSLLPQKRKKGAPKNREPDENERRDIAECIGALLPYYILRARILAANAGVGPEQADEARKLSEMPFRGRYRTYEPLTWEISRIRFELVALNPTASAAEIRAFIDYIKSAKHFALKDRLTAVRAVFRLPHLQALQKPLEMSCAEAAEAPSDESSEEHANWFVSLARAVLPTSGLDAAAYLNRAVEAVSKFGDEMVERWEAVVALARRASEDRKSTPETTYRFVRCAEIIGENVAREKYWDRDDVFRVAVRLDAPSAFAALSRWRDRGIGSFCSQLKSLAKEAVTARILLPKVAWCLSGFEGCNASVQYASVCVQHERSKATQQLMLNAAVRDLELAGTSLEKLKELAAVADAARLRRGNLTRLIMTYESAKGGSPVISCDPIALDHDSSDRARHCPDGCFDGIDLLVPQGSVQALARLRATEPPWEFKSFWKELVDRVPQGGEAEFLEILALESELDSYDIREAVSQARIAWRTKAAVKRSWLSFLKAIGRRLTLALSSQAGLSHFRRETQMDAAEVTALKSGVVEGLAEFPDLIDAGSLFGFVRNMVDRLTIHEASELLDYSLMRFEQHIEAEHADGPWCESLKPPTNVSEAVVGLIWSSLASPYSAIRWQAAHCVRRLAANSCENEINALVDLIVQSGAGGAFASRRFPFYDLHAKLYLLIALARVTLNDATLLKPHAEVFVQVALAGMPHVLIQKTSADIALAIERQFPLTYSIDVVSQLQGIVTSPLPVAVTNDYRYQAETPWHVGGQVDLSLDVHFGYDFDQYWFEPLGSVFGVSEKGIIELARDMAVHTLGIAAGNAYLEDPRQSQWSSLDRFDGRYNTWHSHGTYPRVDNFIFYCSYHTCLALAAKLLPKMRVVRGQHDHEEDRWQAWLARHTLTRSNGKWLSDRRDATPIHRRPWVSHSEREHWEWKICAGDFEEILRQPSSLPKSLCVSGRWLECDGQYEEEVQIESALVNSANAVSLAAALRSSNEIHWSALPRFDDGESDFRGRPSEISGWIHHSNHDERRLDAFDPYARDIQYPPRRVSEKFVSLLSLLPDEDCREWRLPYTSDPSLISEVWSDKTMDRHERPSRFGERIQASFELLIMLCSRTQKALIIEVRIKRRIDERYSPRSNETAGPVPPSRKLFILSADGVLRDKQ